MAQKDAQQTSLQQMFLQASGIAPPSIAVKSKRLRRACGALDSAGWLCSEAIKEAFASLCSKGASFQFGDTDADAVSI